MLVARPIEAFRVGDRRVLACQVAGGDASRFLGKAFSLFCEGKPVARITIEGVSTASPIEAAVFDFRYSGDEIRPDQVGDGALLAEGHDEDAFREAIVA